MNKLLIGILSAALLLPAGYSLAGGLDDGRSDATFAAGTTTARTTTGRTTTVGTTTDRDRRAEKGGRGDRKRGRNDRIRPREPGEDVRGPCDEAEHRNDPRCTGGAVGDDDNSGPGRGGDRGDEDRSGHRGGKDSDD